MAIRIVRPTPPARRSAPAAGRTHASRGRRTARPAAAARLLHERPGDQDALALAAGERAERRVGELGHPDLAERLAGSPPLGSARRPPPRERRERSHERDVQRRDREVKSGPLRLGHPPQRPWTTTSPAAGASSPARTRNRLVLPPPFGPGWPRARPARAAKVTSSSAGVRRSRPPGRCIRRVAGPLIRVHPRSSAAEAPRRSTPRLHRIAPRWSRPRIPRGRASRRRARNRRWRRSRRRSSPRVGCHRGLREDRLDPLALDQSRAGPPARPRMAAPRSSGRG